MSLLLGSTVYLSVMHASEHRPLGSRMSAPGLTSEAQLRYILQWFGEFSELQREDFLPVLAAARGDQPDQLAAVLANISCHDKPVSLFQCRIKLFNEWFPTWAEEEQDRLIKGVSEQDPEFGAKLQDILLNGPQVNGNQDDFFEQSLSKEQNGTSDNVSPTEDDANGTWANGENPEPEVEENAEDPLVVSENIPVEIAAAS
ncbi:unnamed protein product [Arctia plantaginis]|uniref:Uncharacterized protein n=1 Tax=Arctia plantaginis TaxID=874455 RepID=A0A8S1AVI5_ARCPL|nr:unnamed protein product [Arctia plantaginis]CAB3249031.1 unnamed protein product [Arctia plantaginis]